MALHLLSLWDFSRHQLQYYLDLARKLKHETKTGIRHQQLAGRTIGMIFEKPSTRTRVSFEAAMYGLGGQVVYLSGRDTQLSRNEPLKDMARVMSRYVDGLVVRTFGQKIVEELACYATVPVINALTDLHHPCQVLSDIMTVLEKKGPLEELKVVWIGDGNNMANSWIEAAGRLGFSLTIACPPGYEPDAGLLARVRQEAAKAITVLHDPQAAMQDADVVNTDVWASMGQEAEQQEREKIFQPYRVDEALLARAKTGAIVLHCLPAHRGEEISEGVLEGPQCVAFDQAENKLHLHKAILLAHLSGEMGN